MIENIQKIISSYTYNEVVIHSDISRGFILKEKNREVYLDKTIKIFFKIFNNKNIIMPCFNYDFFITKKFNLVQDISQVGILNEYFRLNYSNWRSKTPVFSYSGTGIEPNIKFNNLINPFDKNSIFNFFYNNNTLNFYYGAAFDRTTFIHYIETISNKIRYRYYKLFDGTIYNESKNLNVKLKYLVRPLKIKIEYDWTKIESDLIKNKILKKITDERSIFYIYESRPFVDFLLTKIDCDDMYLLSEDSKKIVDKKFKELNKNYFDINDFG